MILLFEEYQYKDAENIALIKQCINEAYLTETDKGVKVCCVGYFFCTNPEVNDAVFVLPKVFVDDKELAFGKCPIEEIVQLGSSHDNELIQEKETIFELSAWLYQAIAHFVKNHTDTDIVKMSNVQEVKSAKGEKNQTYIDIILQLRRFQKEHRHLFTYISIVNRSGTRKVNWNKTVRKVQPFLQEGTPIYMDFYNKTKSINFDEELIVLFYSALRFLQEKMRFKTVCDLRYDLIPVRKIESMIAHGQGTRRLRTIRKKYFTDELVSLWNLLYVFFDKAEQIAAGKYHQEKMIAIKFNIIFEDMIDQLIGDQLTGDDAKEKLNKLKTQKDGKRLDHLYKADSLVNSCGEIYFIGDSKYYKESTDLGPNSVYKQFTYAKNIIQYHIDIFNTGGSSKLQPLYYRDDITEGYNITPNFFIRASAIKEENGLYSYTEDGLVNESDTDVKNKENKLFNCHFPNRLFDRDTFVLQTYNINFLYVLAHYVQGADESIKASIRQKFRKDLLDRFNALYDFWILTPKNGNLQSAIDKHFRKINGKVFCPNPKQENPLIYLALEKEDVAEEQPSGFMMYRAQKMDDLALITALEEDFDVYKLPKLGDNPQEVIDDEKAKRKNDYRYPFYQNQYGDWPVAAEALDAYNGGLNLDQHSDDVFLIGCYKNNAHLNWIQEKMKYNVRLGDRRGAVKENDEQVETAKWLILYSFEEPSTYSVYPLESRRWVCKKEDMDKMGYKTPKVCKKEDMDKMGYPTPNGEKYLLYFLKDAVTLNGLKVSKIIEDHNVQKGSEREGAPIYLTGSKLEFS